MIYNSKCPECYKAMSFIFHESDDIQLDNLLLSIQKDTLCESCGGKKELDYATKIQEDERIKSNFKKRQELKNSGISANYHHWDEKKGNTELMNFILNNKSESLFIHGDYGINKSRCVSAVGVQEIENGKTVRYYRTIDLLDTFSLLYFENLRSVEKLKQELYNIDLLILDDFGKEKLTNRTSSVLYAIIDYRYMHNRPIWITTNLSGSQLEHKLGEDYGQAIRRRLKEKYTQYKGQ